MSMTGELRKRARAATGERFCGVGQDGIAMRSHR
jgi:hypothetical protein